MLVSLSSLRQKSETRPEGYVDEVVAHGAVCGDHLDIAPATLATLQRKYYGLGDVVAVIAHPVAQLLDAAFGTDLANCAGCKNRHKAWNVVPVYPQ